MSGERAAILGDVLEDDLVAVTRAIRHSHAPALISKVSDEADHEEIGDGTFLSRNTVSPFQGPGVCPRGHIPSSTMSRDYSRLRANVYRERLLEAAEAELETDTDSNTIDAALQHLVESADAYRRSKRT